MCIRSGRMEPGGGRGRTSRVDGRFGSHECGCGTSGRRERGDAGGGGCEGLLQLFEAVVGEWMVILVMAAVVELRKYAVEVVVVVAVLVGTVEAVAVLLR